MARYCIGIDLGGTYIKFGLLDEQRRLSHLRQLPTPSGGQAVVEQMVGGALAMLKESGISPADVGGAGVGAPGPLDIAAGVILTMPNIQGMDNLPICDMLSARLAMPVALDNDANCAALGEHLCGGLQATNLVLLTLGTGVGSGIIVDGRLLHGAHGVGAEIGHMLVQPGGEPCNCGQHGCIERYCSATFIALRATRMIEAGRDGLLADVLARKGSIDSRDIEQAAAAGDKLATEVWDSAAYYLAVGCVNIARTLDPDAILLGGGLANAGDALLTPVRTHFSSLHWKLTGELTRIELARLGNDAGTAGAAGVAWARFGRSSGGD